MIALRLLALTLFFCRVPLLAEESALTIPAITLNQAFQQRESESHAFVLMDTSTGGIFLSDPVTCNQPQPPCSTFKIWNSAIGLECSIIKDPDAPFWEWDGVKRGMDDWNRNQTLRTAFARSCVPAYQNLARQIGKDRMQVWLKKISYGNQDITAGLDVFWLPKPPDRRPILISPKAQAELIAKLIHNQLPFSTHTRESLKSIMLVTTTDQGRLYGKTGSGTDEKGNYAMGWFVGYIESTTGKTYTFACWIKGQGIMGKDSKAATESILGSLGLL
jgi:beta-lactamase class D